MNTAVKIQCGLHFFKIKMNSHVNYIDLLNNRIHYRSYPVEAGHSHSEIDLIILILYIC